MIRKRRASLSCFILSSLLLYSTLGSVGWGVVGVVEEVGEGGREGRGGGGALHCALSVKGKAC
jgi:hypothetical protein